MIAVAMATYLTLQGPVHAEPDPIKKSRFIADGTPVAGLDEAKAFVESIQVRYPDAGHHCFAWRMGQGDLGFRTSDDGEPGGTAGQPILNHIDGARLLGVVFVVTRYFGGTKLGKGGLIRAYGGTAGEAIRTATIIEVQETERLTITADYADQGTIEGIIRGFGLGIEDAQYSERVRLSIPVPVEEVATVRALLIEGTAGRVIIS